MTFSDIQFDPSRRTLRWFALSWLVFLSGFAVWQYIRLGNLRLASALAIAALLGGVAGLAYPPVIRWLYVGSTLLTFPLGWTVSRVVMAISFYVLVTPIGVTSRLGGRDTLRLRDRSAATYWEPKEQPSDLSRYFQLF
jgi:hypothetical protein